MNAVTKSLTVIVLLIAATPVMARKLAEIPIVVDNSVIGDRHAGGVVDMQEATALMKDCSLKREMFSQEMDEQKRLYLSLKKKIRLKLMRLSRAYGTLRWEYAIDLASRKGLSPIDGERIALALRK